VSGQLRALAAYPLGKSSWYPLVRRLWQQGENKFTQAIQEDCWKNLFFGKKIVTNGETWVFQYDPQIKHQNLQWECTKYENEERVDVKIRSQNHADLFVSYRIMDCEFIPSKQTMN
jgi:hypothetical protein